MTQPTGHGTTRPSQELQRCESPERVSSVEPTSLTFGPGFTHDCGPLCDRCDTTEARCARNQRCCDDCTHTWGARGYKRRQAS